MKTKYLGIYLVLILAICSLSQAADLLVEDFESYADTAALTGVWVERNPAVVTLSLEMAEAKDGTKSMVLDYNCHNTPYWSEAYTIFDANVDWSAYNTLNIWLKGYIGDVPGREPNQSLENMYIVLYKPKAEYPNPVDNSQLEMQGKTGAYRATKIADWTLLRFNLGQNFEPLTDVRAIGIGMSPDSYGGGIVKIDAISLEEESYGGIINNFEGYASTVELQNAPDINEGNSVASSLTLVNINDVNDANVLEGEKALKFEFNNGVSPWYSKVVFYITPNHALKYAWGWPSFNAGMNYNPFTINFKVANPEGRMQLVLIGADGNAKATYDYPSGTPRLPGTPVSSPYRVPAGDWTRWDIDLPSVYYLGGADGTELDSVLRAEIQFLPIDGNDYGTGVVYLDDIHVNNCADGASYTTPTGQLRADLNGDCVVDFMDFVAFAEHWRQTGCNASNQFCGGADFLRGPDNPPVRDGKVDLNDLLIVTYRWLDCNMLFQGDCLIGIVTENGF